MSHPSADTPGAFRFLKFAGFVLPIILVSLIIYQSEVTSKRKIEDIRRTIDEAVQTEESSSSAVLAATDAIEPPGPQQQNEVEVDAGSSQVSSQTGVDNYRVAQIALSELGVTESEPGCNCGPRIEEYTGGNHSQWCAYFASWVYAQAGIPIQGPDGSRVQKAQDINTALQQGGTWISKQQAIDENLTPNVGDLVVFYRGAEPGYLGHVDIVVARSDTPGVVSTVGGNIENQVAFRANQNLFSSFGFIGFGRP